MNLYKNILLICFALILSACSSPKTSITLLQLNDVYEISPLNGGKTGGVARIATLLQQLRKANPNTYGILAGDLLSPSAIGTSIQNGEPLAGKQMIALFNHLKWDYATFGNHEFDIGKTALLKRLAESDTVFFSSNVLDSETGKPLLNSQKTVVFEVDGVKVGLIGVTLSELKQKFIQISDPLIATQQAIQKLKQQQVELIILVTHQDLESDIQFAEKLDDVDLIIGGHEHENIYLRRGKNLVPIAKADANAKSAFIHQISVDKHNGSKQIESKLLFLDETIALDTETEKLVQQWQQQAFNLFKAQGFEPERIIAQIKEPLDGQEASIRNKTTALTDLIANAYLHAYPEADVSLYNGGSIRIDDILPAGAITEYDVIKILPFSGELQLVKMSGEILQKALKAGLNLKGHGGFLHYANIGFDKGQWQVAGKAIELTKDYKVVTVGFLLEKGDAGLEFLKFSETPSIKRLTDVKIDTRKALINEILQIK